MRPFSIPSFEGCVYCVRARVMQFDGSDGCRCQKGFTNVNGVCTPAGVGGSNQPQAGARGFGGF